MYILRQIEYVEPAPQAQRIPISKFGNKMVLNFNTVFESDFTLCHSFSAYSRALQT